MRGLCQWWLESIASPCVPLKIRVRSWSKNANIQLKMAQNTHQFVLSPLSQKLMEENDKKYQLLDIQNIISLLLLHIKYFYCRPESMVWRNLLKIYVLQSCSAASNALESGEIFRREATWERMMSARMSFGRDYGTLALSLCPSAAWLCWDEELSLLNAPIKMFCLVSEMKAAGKASMG